jgi:hypothetical protein
MTRTVPAAISAKVWPSPQQTPRNAGLVAAALAGHERRHRGEMIRFERVPHAEQRAEARAGHEFEYWHDSSALILYLRSCS